jgi:hypothetical protein
MVFFFSQKTKDLTTIVGIVGLIGLTDRDWRHLLLYKFTYGHPETDGFPYGHCGVSWECGFPAFCDRRARIRLLAFVVAYSQSIAEQDSLAELSFEGCPRFVIGVRFMALVLTRSPCDRFSPESVRAALAWVASLQRRVDRRLNRLFCQ